jgi:hypothetical protein
MKFVSDLQQVGGFLQVLRFPPPIKLSHDITEILLKVALNTIEQTNKKYQIVKKSPLPLVFGESFYQKISQNNHLVN